MIQPNNETTDEETLEQWNVVYTSVGPVDFSRAVDAACVADHLVSAAQDDLAGIIHRMSGREKVSRLLDTMLAPIPDEVLRKDLGHFVGLLLVALAHTAPLATEFPPDQFALSALPSGLAEVIGWYRRVMRALEAIRPEDAKLQREEALT